MAQIRINIHNCDSYIYGIVPDHVFFRLREELSFRVQNCEFSEKYNTIDPDTHERKWDGRIYLVYKLKNSIRFSTGLLSMVRRILDDEGMEYSFTDSRPKYDKEIQIEFADNFTLRDYQLEAVEKSIKRERGIVKAATGAGKTPMSAGIIKYLGLKGTMFLAMSGDLLIQAKDEFQKFLRVDGKPIIIGQVGSGICDIQDITVCTVQSLCTAFDIKYKKADDEDDTNNELDESILNKKEDIRKMIVDSKCIIFDEVQHASCDTVKDIMKKSLNAKYRFGMSVFSDSFIELKGNMFNDGQSMKIEDCWNSLETINLKYTDSGYEFLDLEKLDNKIYSRGWDNSIEEFSWKMVKKIIRHKNTKKSYNIRFAGKNNLKMTEDHSLFRIVDDSICECRPVDLKEKDVVVIDNGKNWNGIDYSTTILDVLSENPDNFRVGINISNIDKKSIGKNSQQFWQLTKRGKVAKEYGGSLSLVEYLRYKDILPEPKWIYTEGSNGVGVSPCLSLKDIAYFYGFYLGDGWIEQNRISFAVEDNFVDEFISNLLIEKLKIKFNIRNLQGCKQVRVSCKPLVKFFISMFGSEKCYNKKISDKVLFSSEDIRRNVLRGMIDSDGSVSRTNEDHDRNRKPIRYTTTSESLKSNICTLLRSLNVQYTVSEREPANGGIISGRRIKSNRISWQIIFSENALNGNSVGHNGNIKNTNIDCIEKNVLSVEEIEVNSNDYVYDLEMDSHPSFVANGLLVHNSASPWRDDGSDLFIDSQFGKSIVDISASYLIRRKFLVKPTIYFIYIETPQGTYSNYQTIYKNFIVNNIPRNQAMAELARIHASRNETVLILVKHLNHGKMIESMIEGSIFISGKMAVKKRKVILDELRENKRKIVIASSLFDEGIDVKCLNCLILGSSGKSSTRALQRIGRVLRPFTDKDCATIYDFMDSAKYLNAHARARKKIYETEEEFEIKELKIGEWNEYKNDMWEFSKL